MKTIVQVGPGEVVRMVALTVLGRPENAGKVVCAVEMEQTAAGTVEMRVIVCDTPAEAMQYAAGVAEVVASNQPQKATVLQLVPPAQGAEP